MKESKTSWKPENNLRNSHVRLILSLLTPGLRVSNLQTHPNLHSPIWVGQTAVIPSERVRKRDRSLFFLVPSPFRNHFVTFLDFLVTFLPIPFCLPPLERGALLNPGVFRGETQWEFTKISDFHEMGDFLWVLFFFCFSPGKTPIVANFPWFSRKRGERPKFRQVPPFWVGHFLVWFVWMGSMISSDELLPASLWNESDSWLASEYAAPSGYALHPWKHVVQKDQTGI